MMTIQNFKNYVAASLIAASSFAVISCSKETDSVTEKSKFEIKNFDVQVTAKDSTLTFYAAADWTATLSSTSWIEIDPMTKAGPKGDAKIILKWKANTGLTQRVAELTVVVENEAPFKVKITQLPDAPYVLLSKSTAQLRVDAKAANGKGQFVDTVTVKSNQKWNLKSIPSWINYRTLDDKEPQEGVQTEIKLILSGDPAKFNAALMTADLKVGGAASEAALQVTAESKIEAMNEDNVAVSRILMERTAAVGNIYYTQLIVAANTSWELTGIPAWAKVTATDNSTEYASNLKSKKTIRFFMQDGTLDTDILKGDFKLVNKQTGATATVELVFPGTGINFFETDLLIPADFEFSASAYDSNWQPIEGAVLSKDFNMYSGKNYTSVNDAPFKIFFVKSQNGFTMKEEIFWAGADMNVPAKATRSTLVKNPFTLWVADRSTDEGDKSKPRNAYVVYAPKGVQFNDLFIAGTDDLKPEYDEAKTYITQKAMASDNFESEIPQLINFGAAAGSNRYALISGANQISMEYTADWLIFDFELDEYDAPLAVIVNAKANTTGVARSVVVKIMNFNSETEESKEIYQFTVEQAAQITKRK